jgi:glycosyltransferase involved in cell wall biosynthesis
LKKDRVIKELIGAAPHLLGRGTGRIGVSPQDLPMVAPLVGGIPKAVEQGRTGLLFQSGDETAMATAIVRLLDQESLRTAIATAGKAEVLSRYSLQRMADDYERRYRTALAVA